VFDLDGSMDRNEVANRLDAALAALRAESKELPRDTFDPGAVIHQVGHDPAAIFAWVRDNTTLVPYRGVLRGSRGVLLDRFGNSLDRSLLLAQLLQLAGHDVRLAHATLPPDQVQTVLRRARSVSVRTPGPQIDVATSERALARVNTLADSLDVDASELLGRFKAIRDAADRTAEIATRRSMDQSKQLREILTGKLASAERAKENQPPDELADHWWVQLRQDEQWTDLDPILLSTGPGRSTVDAATTINPQSLQESLHHLLRIRVIIERAAEGRLEQQPVLEHTLRLSDVIGVPITLAQFPSQIAPDAPDQSADGMAQHYQQWLDDQQEWIPVLVVGDKSTFQFSFTLAGGVQQPGSILPLSPAGGFSDALGGGESESAATELTAVFAEYEFLAPGSPPRIERRFLVDVIGPSARERGEVPAAGNRPAILGLDLIRETELLPIVAQPSPAFVAQLSSASLLSAGDRLVDLLRNRRTDGSSGEHSTDPTPTYVPAELYSLALARHHWSHVASSVVITSPNLLTRHVGLRQDSVGLSRWSVFDIVANDVDVTGGDHAQRISVRISQGVVDTNAETLLVPDPSGTGNISELMSAEGPARVSWAVVTGPSGDQRVTEALNPDQLTRIRKDLSRGYLAVVPVALPSHNATDTGWWRVDPASGTVLGIDARGMGGSATAEHAEAETNALQSARAAQEFYKLFACAFSDTLLAVSIAQKTGSNALGAGSVLPGLALCTAASSFKVVGLIGGGSKVASGYLSLFGDLLGHAGWSYRATMAWWAKFG
jgi:hypothetical protein